MKKRVLAVLTLALLGTAKAADETEIVFTEGTVLVRCVVPDGHPQISTELFNAGFPHWISNLQKQANEGLISRVHYLGELKEGLFIVVEGSTRTEAKDNALVVIKGINTVMEQAIEASGEQPGFDQSDACQSIEIGPVAILPR